jgi:cobalamin biosynthesis protein CobT
MASDGWHIPIEVHVDRAARFVRILMSGETLIEGVDLPFELVEAAINEAMLRRAGAPPESEVFHDPAALAQFKDELRRAIEPRDEEADDTDADDADDTDDADEDWQEEDDADDEEEGDDPLH